MDYIRQKIHKTQSWFDAKKASGEPALYKDFPPLYPTDFNEFLNGNEHAIDIAIAYLEEDPTHFGAFYYKRKILHRLKRYQLTNEQRNRLNKLLIEITTKRHMREFIYYCRLARVIATEETIQKLYLMTENPKAKKMIHYISMTKETM